MTRAARAAATLLTLLGAATGAAADGGTLVLREVRGPWTVTLFAEPTPRRPGPVAFEVLVQASETGRPLLEIDVRLGLTEPGAVDPIEVEARPDRAGNRLFRRARVPLPRPGEWQIELRVSHAGALETFRTSLDVAPARAPALRYWPYIAAAPVGVALLSLHQALSVARSRARRRSPE